MCRERSGYRRWEAGALLLNAVLFVGVLLVLLGPWSTLLLIAIHQACTGVYLGLVFAPNHKGMAMIDAAAPLDGLRAQVLTARNVRGHPITDRVYSGLNYQIEHRLFPTVPGIRLHRARTIIKAFCAARALSSEEVAPLRAYGQVVTALREGESIMSMLH